MVRRKKELSEKEAARTEGMRETVAGKVDRIYFRSDTKDFRIGSLKEDDGTIVRFLGDNLGFLRENLPVTMSGCWQKHKTYGMQLRVDEASAVEEDSLGPLIRYFSSSRFPGVGEKTAEKIVSALGADAIEKIDSPDVLVDEVGLKKEMAQMIYEKLGSFRNQSGAVLQLLEWQVPEKEIRMLLQLDEDQNEEDQEPFDLNALKDHVFDSYYRIPGFSYEAGERIADGFRLAWDDPQRQEALIYRMLADRLFQSGSTYMDAEKLQYACRQCTEFDKRIKALEERKAVVRDGNRIYRRKFWRAEVNSAHVLYRVAMRWEHMHQAGVEADLSKIDSIIHETEERERIQYDEIQKKAIRSLFSFPMMILTGGPGTGKTTVVKAILGAIGRLHPADEVTLCAPTGRAAKRLADLSESRASTIHSLLGWQGEEGVFKMNRSNPLKCDWIIIDEFSMVDTLLFSALLSALPSDCRILIIGDDEQLESVGEGNVLASLLESGKIPSVALERVFRQEEGSSIAELADEIRHGQPLTFEKPVDLLAPSDSLTQQVKDLVLRQDEPEDLQVLSPMYEGDGGVYELNEVMQEILNPASPQKTEIAFQVPLRSGSRHTIRFRTGDRVMLRVNMAEEDIYNGDLGEITDVDQKSRSVTVNFDGTEVEFSDNLTQTLSHGWCTTVHKAQGSEYRRLILSLPDQAMHMLRKRLVYTAITRAKKKLWIIGSKSRIERAAKNTEESSRKTTLALRLEQAWNEESMLPQPAPSASATDEKEKTEKTEQVRNNAALSNSAVSSYGSSGSSAAPVCAAPADKEPVLVGMPEDDPWINADVPDEYFFSMAPDGEKEEEEPDDDSFWI